MKASEIMPGKTYRAKETYREYKLTPEEHAEVIRKYGPPKPRKGARPIRMPQRKRDGGDIA
jgi:hypothetical protein